MDANLIYIKTPAGEEAVRQRTRVVQRNTRMVLILVDGNSTVGELCQKTGNVQLVESALQDLERDGLIAPKLDQDSVWEQSKKIAEEIKAAAVNRLAKEMPKEAPILPPQAAAAVPEPFSVAPVSIAPFSTFGGQGPNSMAPFSTFGGPPSVAPAAPSAPTPVEEKKAGLFAGLLKRKSADDDAIAPIRKGRSGPFISLPLAIAIGVVGLFVLAVLVFLLYPYDSHRPRIEETLSSLAGCRGPCGTVAAAGHHRLRNRRRRCAVPGSADSPDSGAFLVAGFAPGLFVRRGRGGSCLGARPRGVAQGGWRGLWRR
jgi:hypothetical protein